MASPVDAAANSPPRAPAQPPRRQQQRQQRRQRQRQWQQRQQWERCRRQGFTSVPSDTRRSLPRRPLTRRPVSRRLRKRRPLTRRPLLFNIMYKPSQPWLCPEAIVGTETEVLAGYEEQGYDMRDPTGVETRTMRSSPDSSPVAAFIRAHDTWRATTQVTQLISLLPPSEHAQVS